MPYQIKEGPNELPLIVTAEAASSRFPRSRRSSPITVRNIARPSSRRRCRRAVVTGARELPTTRSAPDTRPPVRIAASPVVRVLNRADRSRVGVPATRANLAATSPSTTSAAARSTSRSSSPPRPVYEVLGHAGDTFLGGDDLDERLVDKMVAKFLVENRIDLRANEVSR